MALLSVCLIVRDEEASLPRCLASVAGIADEIVVADTGSKDRTVEIARAAGARIIEVPWTDDFAAARNAAIEAARGAWVFSIDADESLDPTDRTRLHRKLAAAREPAYFVEIVSPRPRGDVEVARLARLFRRDPAIRYEGRIHESVLGSICRLLGTTTFSPPFSGLRLRHEGYAADRIASLDKRDRNRRLLREEIARRPGEPGLRVLFARENAAAAGGDVLDLPETREVYELLSPAADAFAATPGHGLAEPALALAARLAVLYGEHPRADGWLEALAAQAGWSARGLYAKAERAFAAGEAAAAALLFERSARAPEGCDALKAETGLRGPWTAPRALLCRALDGDAKAASTLAVTAPGRPTEERLAAAIVLARGPAGAMAAVPVLADALKDDAQDPRPWWAMGAILAAAGDTGRARTMMETAVRAAPGWRPALEFLDRGVVEPPRGMLRAWPR